jgi:hypothetical protein
MKRVATIEQWTTFLQRGKRHSNLQIPFEKQQNLISFLFRPDPNVIKQADLCCGRGYGKSVLAIFIATMALSLSSNEIGLFLEPDWKRVKRVFLKKWMRLVPSHLWTINRSEQCITWLPTGSLLYYGPRVITGAQGSMEDSQLGQDTTFVIDDEAALHCSEIFYINTMATIREPSNVRFYLTLSTPRVGSYKNLVTAEKHILFRGTSSDNKYLPVDYVANLRAQMGPEQAARELEGKFVTLAGKIWKYTKWEPFDKEKNNILCAWPNGNRNDTWTSFRKDRPWWLFCDLGGATGAYAVVQQSDAAFRGRLLFRDPVWVAVADYCPTDDASASRAFQKLKAEFGTPVAVVAGADIETRSVVDGRTVSYTATEIWGPSVHIYPVDEHRASKQMQFDVLNFLMCTVSGERRFTIARDFVSLDNRSKRGICEMIEEDEFPPEEKRNPHDVLPKNRDNRVQHIRDALLMGAVAIMRPPQYAYNDDPAL